MRAQLTYPVKAGFHLADHWPLALRDIEVHFDVADGRIDAIRCIWPLGPDDRPPTIAPLEEGQRGIGNVDFLLVRREEIEHAVRTVQGLLSLYGTIDVDFERPTLEWLPDTPEEEMSIAITLSGKPPEIDIYKLETLSFDLVGRAVIGADAASKLEVALSFMRRARRDLKERRYIESIYNSFFFLEALFAAGYSDPKKVERNLLASQVVRDALASIRSIPVDPPRGFTTEAEFAVWERRVKQLARSDEDIIGELVRLRGSLHHNAPKGPAAWHPDKSVDFRVSAHTLHDIALAAAHILTEEALETEAFRSGLMTSAKAAGAITTLRFEARGLFLSKNAMRLSLDIDTAGTVIDRGMVASADREFRRVISAQVPDARIDEYTVRHVASDREYGRYERQSFAEAATRMRKSPSGSG